MEHAAHAHRSPRALVRPGQVRFEPVDGVADGLEVGVMVGREQGAIHLESAISVLHPGGGIGGHRHPFEESFFVLEGEGLYAVGDQSFRLRAGDFGFAPVGYPHAWANPGDGPLRWLRLRAPQPRPIGDTYATYRHPEMAVPADGERIDVESARQRYVGHFEDSQLPAPGPIAMPGYAGYNIRNVSIRMMVDALLGARHHTLFIVQFEPSTVPKGMSAKEHFHPFEEVYYFTHGAADGLLAGEPVHPVVGDCVFAGVNTSHGFTNRGDVPMRWIEAQSPLPPSMHGTLFEADWAR
jgi:mannose-6-phosphate isomerase-like protein (cupin superfamily)